MKRTPIKKKSSNPRKILVGKLDRAFSIFIRQRNSVDGMNTCFTCGVIKPIKELHAGHFMVRQRMSTRWSEINAQPQCVSCNTFNAGRQAEFGIALDEKYGEGTARELIDKSYIGKKHSLDELEALIAYYSSMIKERDENT